MNATEKCCEYKSKYTNNIYDVCEICKINRHLFISDRNNINYGGHKADNAYEYGGHPAPAGPALPNLINAVSMLKSKSKHPDHRRDVPDSGTHDLHVTTTPDPTTSAAETSGSNVASTRGDPDASSPRDASRRRGRARDARMQIMRAATIRPIGVTLGVIVIAPAWSFTYSLFFSCTLLKFGFN